MNDTAVGGCGGSQCGGEGRQVVRDSIADSAELLHAQGGEWWQCAGREGAMPVLGRACRVAAMSLEARDLARGRQQQA